MKKLFTIVLAGLLTLSACFTLTACKEETFTPVGTEFDASTKKEAVTNIERKYLAFADEGEQGAFIIDEKGVTSFTFNDQTVTEDGENFAFVKDEAGATVGIAVNKLYLATKQGENKLVYTLDGVTYTNYIEVNKSVIDFSGKALNSVIKANYVASDTLTLSIFEPELLGEGAVVCGQENFNGIHASFTISKEYVNYLFAKEGVNALTFKIYSNCGINQFYVNDAIKNSGFSNQEIPAGDTTYFVSTVTVNKEWVVNSNGLASSDVSIMVYGKRLTLDGGELGSYASFNYIYLDDFAPVLPVA